MFELNILHSSSNPGNCSVLDEAIMLDAGLSLKQVTEKYNINIKEIKVAFISHEHSDHKSIPLILELIKNKTLVFMPQAVYNEILENNSKKIQEYNDRLKELELFYSDKKTVREPKIVDIRKYDNIICHNGVKEHHVTINDQEYTIKLYPQRHHTIINYCIVIEKEDYRFLYATDMDTLDATDVGYGFFNLGTFDIIEMEGNYDENWLREYIDTTIQTFTNEKLDVSRLTPEELKSWVNLNYQILPKKIYQDLYRATQNMRHLSKQQARAYVLNHLKPNGFYYEVHRSSQYYEKPIQL